MGMPAVQDPDFVPVDDYLEGELRAEERHEYVGGRVVAMAGATEQHETVALNLAAAMLQHLRGKGCRVFKGDMKVRLNLNGMDLFYYPDIMVTCDPEDKQPLYKERPKIIVEVMTEYKSDHVEKLFAYQQIESLEEYLIVNHDPAHPKAWLYRRDREWTVAEGAPEGRIRLETIGFETPLEELYTME